jgi:hypothetical protein
VTARASVVLRGVAALAVLAALVVGVPVALLAATGLPWSGWPPLDDTLAAIADGLVDPALAVRVLVTVVWLAWARLLLAVVAELPSRAGCHVGARRSATRRFAGALVASAGLLVSSLGLRGVPALPGPLSLLDVAAAGASEASTVVVAPGDTLSRLAAERYGDPDEWPRLWEANRGRQFGDRSFDDPNLVLVGWVLDAPAPAPPLPSPSPGEALVLERSASAPDLAVTVPAAPVDVGAAAAPQVPVTAAVPAAGVPAAGAAAALAPAASVAPSPSGAAPAERVSPPAWVQVSGWSGAVLLATGLAGLVASRRQRALRALPSGRTVAPLDPAAAELDALVRLAAAPVAVARLDVALRALAAAAVTSPARPVVVLQRPDGALEVELADPVADAPPAPWVPVSRTRWLLPVTVSLAELVEGAGDATAPCPALVTLGRTDDGVTVHLDLEAVGLLVLVGERVDLVGRAMVATLAVSPVADVVRVVTSGVAVPDTLDTDRVELVDDADAAFEALASLSAPVRAALDRNRVGSTFALRAGRPEEPWEPAVGVVLASAGDPAVAHAADLAGLGGRGVALVTDAAIDARWQLRADGDSWVLDPLGLRITPAGLAADELAAFGSLLHEVAQPPVESASVVVARAPFVEPDWRLMVRLLGTVDVVDRDGVAVAFDRSKALELVAWLALHRDAPTRSAARGALWGTDVRDATFANVVSDARRSMARLVAPAEGEEWLGRTQADRLPLHELVVTDVDLLRARYERARGADDAEAIALLRPGVALVRDQPFTGTSFCWPDTEAVPTELVILGTSASAELARRCLATADIDGAFWATAQGLKVLPGHEELVCLRMEAHAARGDLRGVVAEFEGYERSVLADHWGDGLVAPKVAATRARLLGG